MWIAVAVVAVVVALVVAFPAVRLQRRRRDERRHRAQAIRAEVSLAGDTIAAARRRAEEAKAQAEWVRREAERLQEIADAAEQQALAEEAHVLERVREADRLDPDVDTRAAGYAPVLPGPSRATTDELDRTEAGTLPPPLGWTVPPHRTGGAHRADVPASPLPHDRGHDHDRITASGSRP